MNPKLPALIAFALAIPVGFSISQIQKSYQSQSKQTAMTEQKKFRELLVEAAFALAEAREHLPQNESDIWHLDEAITHISAALDQHKELIRKEDKQ